MTTWNVTIEAIKQKEFGYSGSNGCFAPSSIRVKEVFLKLIYDKAKLSDILELLSKYPLIDSKRKKASVHIPAELKIQIEEIFLKLLVNSEKRMWNAVKLLDGYSMIDLEVGVANIHRLVQKVTELKLEKESREEEVLRETIKLINADYILGDYIVVSVWGYANKHDKLIGNFYFNFTYSIRECMPLHSLAESGDYESVKLILTNIEDMQLGRLNCVVNAKNKDCVTPLHEAAYSGELDILKYLISKGDDIDSGNIKLLHFAVLGQNLRIVEYVINIRCLY
ncbi:ankyrin repeat domain-containing protein [Wolbachia endosymbiont of Mansonella ozzardi]|uniref:ankyrin repeat domain-containing protein n=1 Tax=Wolbachia endosymbiont of Mansonella ozzardi TaxID=137464 RepID=UPI001CE083DF|nr:ankyrin repeat domain-containing protein [Wolbachia endosymbiont of Mansonella ozzardi]MCA4774657.1 ankyrin repeat domain-containing protein [Wolbachia endosymbiont of Mansonella ozzardi]